jgi:hypothetical protein
MVGNKDESAPSPLGRVASHLCDSLRENFGVLERSVSATAFRLSGNVRDERVLDLVDDETRVVSVSHVRSSLEKPLKTEGWSARSGGVKHSCFIKVCTDQEIFLPPD